MERMYIPGDLIMIKNPPTDDFIMEVAGISSDGFVEVIPMDGSAFPHKVLAENVIPIALTPSILEKNGWTNSNLNSNIWRCPKRFLPNIDLMVGRKAYRVIIDHTLEKLSIKYVHELQHLLFGYMIKHKLKL